MTNPTTQAVATQYEKYPYPQISWLAVPLRQETHTITIEWGQYLRTGRLVEHTRQTRILVAGSGTFEALVVARAHPHAQIVAIDLSKRALRELKLRSVLLGLSSRIQTVCADLHEDLTQQLGQFDYIVCTGVLHHCTEPATVLNRLWQLLKSDGVLRLMTYAAHSRHWIYTLQKYFKLRNVKPTYAECQNALAHLCATHPLRLAFNTYDDAKTKSGLIDGFFHAHDEPLTVYKLQALTSQLGFWLLGFGHALHSQPRSFKLPRPLQERFNRLNAWARLKLMDDCAELTVNPVFWLSKQVADITIARPEVVKPNPSCRELKGVQMAPQTQDALLSEGKLIGCDGRLPESIANDRTSPNEAICYDQPLSDPCGGMRPSPIRAAMIKRLRQAALSLDLHSTNELTSLASALEPRVNPLGHELYGLSSGDLLRELHKQHGERMADEFWSYPTAPPSTLQATDYERGATHWFCPS